MIIIAPKLTRLLSFVIDVHAITLWPFIIVRAPMNAVTDNHERIHLAQQLELLLVGFYTLYLWDYLVAKTNGLGKADAYRAIRFEQEAYAYQDTPHYLKTRPFWAWRDF
jgi:hypothetical protein